MNDKEISSLSEDERTEINDSNKECRKRVNISSISCNSSNDICKNSKKQKKAVEDQFCSSSSDKDTENDILKKDNVKGLWKIIEIVSEIGLNESRTNLKILQEQNNLKSFINLEKECDKIKNVLSIILTFLNKASDSIVLLLENPKIFNEELKLAECSLWIETIKRFINSDEFKSPFTLKLLTSSLNAALENLKTVNLNEPVKVESFKTENIKTSFHEEEVSNNDKEDYSKVILSENENDEKKKSVLSKSKSKTETLSNHQSGVQNLDGKRHCSNLLQENDEILEGNCKMMDKKNFFDSDWEDSCTESSSESEQALRESKKTKAEHPGQNPKSSSKSNDEDQELLKLLKMSSVTDKKKVASENTKKLSKPQKRKLSETEKDEEETLMNFFNKNENCEKKNYECDEMQHIWQNDFEAGANAGLKSMYLMSSDDSLINSEVEEEEEEEKPQKKEKKKSENIKEKPKRKGKNFNYSHYFYSTSSESEEEISENSSSNEIEQNDVEVLENSNINDISSTKLKDCDFEENSDTNIILNIRKGRRNIKKIIKKAFLVVETKEARKLELARKERIIQREKRFEKEFGTDNLKLILDFDTKNKKELLTVDEKLARELKPHQRTGVKFMWNCCFESLKRMEEDSGSGCILAHCMGLGKTLQVITLVYTLLSNCTGVQSVMIMTPLNILKYWLSEFKHWLSRCTYQIVLYDITSCNTRKNRLVTINKWINNGGVLLIGYEIFRSMVNPKKKKGNNFICNNYSNLLNPGPDVIILDEGHLLKNDNSALSKSVAQIKTLRRIILTGTPLQNNLIEYYCMVHFVKPNILGTKKEFMNTFVNPIKNGQFEDSTQHDVRLMKRQAHVLHSLLSGFVHRLGYNVLRSCLPEKLEYVIKVALTKTQDTLYRLFLEKCIEINDGLLINFHCLQKIWTHPWILSRTKTVREDESHQNFDLWTQYANKEELNDIESSGKMILLFKILLSCKKVGDKVIIFSQFLRSLDMIEYFLKLVNEKENSEFKGDWNPNINYFRMDGTTTIENRSEYCRRFNDRSDSSARLFLISTRAGGLGINLIAANRVVLFDVSWNPMNDLQSIFRIYRFGQNKPCYIYRLIAEGTMEEKIYQRQVTKLSLAHRILDEYQIERHYSQTNLQELYRYEPLPKNKWEIPIIPKDILFAEILSTSKDIVVSYHEHDSLLENREEEELTEEERQAAWKDFEEDRINFSQLTNTSGTETVMSQISTQATIPRYVTEVTIPGHVTQATIPGHVTQATIPGHVTQATIPGHVTQATIPGHVTQATIPGRVIENQYINESYLNLVNSEPLNVVNQYRQSIKLPLKLPLNHNLVLNENQDSICKIVDVRTLTINP